MTKPNVDLSEFFKLSRPKKPPCRVGFAREQLGEPERTQLDHAVSTDGSIITAAAIVEWLAKRGHETSASAVTSHRKRTCSCRDDA